MPLKRLANTLQDVLKACLQDILKTFWRHKKYLLGMSVSNGLLANLNQYLANLFLTNLNFTNLRRIQNALIRTQSFLYSSYFKSQSA